MCLFVLFCLVLFVCLLLLLLLLFGGLFLFVCCFGFFACFLFVCLFFVFVVFNFIVGMVWNRLAMEILIVCDLLLSVYKSEPKISQFFQSNQVKSININHLLRGNSANS